MACSLRIAIAELFLDEAIMDVLVLVLPVRAAVVRERARELRGEAAARERWNAVKRVAALEAMIAGYVSISVVVVLELDLSRERGRR